MFTKKIESIGEEPYYSETNNINHRFYLMLRGATPFTVNLETHLTKTTIVPRKTPKHLYWTKKFRFSLFGILKKASTCLSLINIDFFFENLEICCLQIMLNVKCIKWIGYSSKEKCLDTNSSELRFFNVYFHSIKQCSSDRYLQSASHNHL